MRWILLGIVMGLAYLTNYPAVVLPIALVGVHLVRHGRRAFGWRVLAGPALSALVMFVVVMPWLMANASWFGGPFWSQPFQRTLAGGSRQVEYVLVDGEAVKRNLPSSADRMASLRERAIDLYGNVGFVAKQSLVLAPMLGGLFLVGLVLLVPMPAVIGLGSMGGDSAIKGAAGAAEAAEGASTEALIGEGAMNRAPTVGGAVGARFIGPNSSPVPVAVLALVHLALIIWWPTTKFRYVIPLLPLVFAIGAWALWQFRPGALRLRLAAITLGLCLFTNAWSMLSIPSRTFYYDGGLIGDNFGQQGERQFMEEARSFRAAADAIVAWGPGVILADHILAPFTGMPLVVNSTGYPPEIIGYLVQKYDIRYVVIDRAHAGLYDFLKPTQIWSDERLVVLELPSD
jgi:4-amino-4-deoxy-L-arabinose transferase-like glycosyltransferase